MPSRVRTVIETGLGLVYPAVCELCGERPVTVEEGYVCPACWSRPGALRFIRPPYCGRCGLPYEGEITGEFTCGNCRGLDLAFVSARAAVVASDFVLEVIHRYKYARALWFEPFLVDLLHRAAGPWLAERRVDFLVPVPLHPVKRREREFNQSERLAAGLGRRTGVPFLARGLRRVRATPSQTLLNRTDRAKNVAHAFVAEPRPEWRAATCVVVDDVLTTGATTSACARALRRAGAAAVHVWTVARGL
jgi:ComF family protein